MAMLMIEAPAIVGVFLVILFIVAKEHPGIPVVVLLGHRSFSFMI
jgi:hypothetical protein